MIANDKHKHPTTDTVPIHTYTGLDGVRVRVVVASDNDDV